MWSHHNLKKVTTDDCDTLYAFRKAVAEARNQIREDIANGSAEDMHAMENLYTIIKKVLLKVEQLAFGKFEEYCHASLAQARLFRADESGRSRKEAALAGGGFFASFANAWRGL